MHSLRSVSAVLVLAFLLAACGQKANLPPEEVIRRAIIKSNTVQSFAVSLSAQMQTDETQALSGSVILQAIVRSGGQVWSADTSFEIESTMPRGHERASGRLIAISPGTGQTYLRLESAEGALGELLKKSFSGSNNGWMVYGQNSDKKLLPRDTPDPQQLSSYADVIVVTENLGTKKDETGRVLYHYRVALKPELLSSLHQEEVSDTEHQVRAEGEMWIDSDNFSLLRAKWDLGGVPTSLGNMTLRIDALFSQYDSASGIQTPVGSAALLPLESIFAIFSQ